MVWSFHLYAGSLLGVPIIVAEVLASFINADERIEGIQIGDHEIKIVNFTDDTTIFWRYITYLNRIQVILKLYEDASSSKINFSKSQALWARSYKNRIDQPGQMKSWKFPLKYLELTSVTLFSITTNRTK